MDTRLTYEDDSWKRHKKGSWYLYIIRTGNVWAPYVGITADPGQSLREHVEGKGHPHTRAYGVRSMHVVARYASHRRARLAEKKAQMEIGVVEGLEELDMRSKQPV